MSEQSEKKYSWISYTYITISATSLLLMLLTPVILEIEMSTEIADAFFEFLMFIPFAALALAVVALFHPREKKGITIFGLFLSAINIFLVWQMYQIVSILEDLFGFVN